MPKPKKRSKREERREDKRKARDLDIKKRKRSQATEETDEPHSKRQKSQDAEEGDIEIHGVDTEYQDDGFPEAIERPFYGLLQAEEQEYFRRADELLELNDFPTEEERKLFLANVYREAEGKELKIACSQSCSRLMERLILLSNTEQKKKLFEKFVGNFVHLVQHRFASHCCEALFIQSATVVTEELGMKEIKDGLENMENLFLQTLDELETSIPTLLTCKFASHTLRALLVILSGRPLEQSFSLLQSKKKERIAITGFDTSPESSLQIRPVPSSFTHAIQKIITYSITSMTPSFIRILTTHPTGNPTLQLLLELELARSKSSKSKKPKPSSTEIETPTLLTVLLPDDQSIPESESQTLLIGLLYHPIGSHLLEVLLQHAPSKLFKSIYFSIILPKITSLARNDIACYPLIRALSRLIKEDLQTAISVLLPQIPDLVTRHRTIVIKTLLERCEARGAETEELTTALFSAFGSDTSTFIQKIVDIDPSTISLPLDAFSDQQIQTPPQSPHQIHASFLCQTMLSIPGPPRELILTSLLSLPPSTLLRLCLYPPTSRIIQHSLSPTTTTTSPSPSSQTQNHHRKLLSTLFSSPPSTSLSNPSSIFTSFTPLPPALQILALNPSGTHLLTTIFTLTTSTSSLFLFCERITAGLAALNKKMDLRGHGTGRWVWRLYRLEEWGRNGRGWVGKMKGSVSSREGFGNRKVDGGGGGEKGKEKTGLRGLGRGFWR